MKSLVPVFILTLFCLPDFLTAADDAGVQFFEQKIRPVLVEHCYGCHSAAAREAKKLQAELYLDSAAGVLAGGENGPSVVKNNPAESLLLKALKHEGLEMPPAGKLPEEVIADFSKWIEMGAPDPREGELPGKAKREIDIEEGQQWWSFRPLQNVTSPDPQKPIDGFVRQAQVAQGLTPNPSASKGKLIRRAYFDVIGLPPTPEQVAAFESDTSPQAFERVVDELLASPAYGERWARHWLDTARFAESGGYEFDGFRPGAYHYRDWVIRSLNNDLPYDEFVRMQLAADLLAPDDLNAASATGFLVAGPYPGQITAKTVERIRYDQLDDMMMTMGGSMLGLTLGCVRCHEHKYDPIPHQDYYALVSTLARTAHGPRTMDVNPQATLQAQLQHQMEYASLLTNWQKFAATELPVLFNDWKGKELNNQPELSRWQSLEPISLHAERSYLKNLPNGIIVPDGTLPPGSEIYQHGSKRTIKGAEEYRLTFQSHQKNLQALRLDAFTDKSLPQRGPGLNGDGSFQLISITVTARPADPAVQEPEQVLKLKPVFAAFEDSNQPLAHAVDDKPETAWVVRETAKKDNAAIFEFETPVAGFTGGTEFKVELKFRDLGIGRLRVAFSAEPNPATWAGEVTSQHLGEIRALVLAHPADMPEPVRQSLVRWFAPFNAESAKILQAIREHVVREPRPQLTEVYTTVAGGQDVYYLQRGEVDKKQDKAEPGFLQVLWRGDAPARPAPEQPPVDPRLAMARWITDVEQGAGPLIARVMVNRVWLHHFGQGIVGTPNDFGVQGDPPTHPELLEFLAREFVQGGWKLKPLHRLILLSDTYQQSHEAQPENLKLDPTNRYLSYFQPRRLEAEAIRDSLLAAGGNLDPAMFGPSVLDNTQRRSIYLRVKRSELLPVMTMFDAPEPTQSIGERSVTTVPTQALALMNSPFVRQQSERLFNRIKPSVGSPLSSVVDRGYQLALNRLPSDAERSLMLSFIEQQRVALGEQPEAMDKALVEFCQVLLCLNEFVYID